MLKKIISGCQNGADIGGILAADGRLETGGWMPKGFKTLDGPKPHYAAKYNVKEHSSPSYPPRTHLNAKESDGTIRFAADFTTAGEVCTLNGIKKHKKPYIDVNVLDPIPHAEVVKWIQENNIETLNVAGNSEKTYKGMSLFVMGYLREVFDQLGV